MKEFSGVYYLSRKERIATKQPNEKKAFVVLREREGCRRSAIERGREMESLGCLYRYYWGGKNVVIIGETREWVGKSETSSSFFPGP